MAAEWVGRGNGLKKGCLFVVPNLTFADGEQVVRVRREAERKKRGWVVHTPASGCVKTFGGG